MTGFALGVHQSLIKKGINPKIAYARFGNMNKKSNIILKKSLLTMSWLKKGVIIKFNFGIINNPEKRIKKYKGQILRILLM